MQNHTQSNRPGGAWSAGAARTGAALVLLAGVLISSAAGETARKETEADLQFEFADKLYEIKVYKTAAAEYARFLKDYPQDVRREEARYKLALSCFQLGENEYQRALGELVTLRKEFPAGKLIQDCLFRSGHIRYLLGDAKGAAADLTELGKLEVRADLVVPMHHFLGRALCDLGQFGEAVKHLSVVADAPVKTPLRPFALIVLADAYTTLKDVPKTAATLDTVIGDYPDLAVRDEMRLRAGDARLTLKQFEKALAAYGNVGAKGPLADRAAIGKARALLGLKRDAEAAGVCRALLAGFRETPANKGQEIPAQGLYLLGLAEFGQGKYDEAAGEFSKLLAASQQGPAAEDGALKLCWCYYRAGTQSAKKLVESCSNFLKLFPASRSAGQAGFLMGEGYLRLGDYESAIAQFKKLDEKDPSYGDALYRIAYGYYKLGKREEAGRAYDLFVQKFASHDRAASALAAAGDVYQENGKYAEAIDRYTKYLAADPRGAEADEVTYQRGMCLAKISRLDEMAAAFNDYTQKFPRGKHAAEAFYWLGRHERVRGDALAEKRDTAGATKEYDLARSHFQAGADLKGENRDAALLGLAECSYTLGRMLDDHAGTLAARAKGAAEPQKTQMEDEAAKAAKESAAALEPAAGGFLDLIARKSPLMKDEAVWFWTGAYFRDHKDPKTAIVVFKGLLANFKEPKGAEPALYQLALLHRDVTPPDYDAAVRYCDELLDRFPTSKLAVMAKFAKAEALYDQGKHGAAESLYVEVTRLDTLWLKASAEIKLGHIYFAKKDYATAVGHFARVGFTYEDKVLTPEALYFAGKSNVLMKELGDTVKFWQDLLKRYPDSKWAVEAKKELGPLGYAVADDGTISRK